MWIGGEDNGTYHIPAQHQGQRRNDSIIHQQARWLVVGGHQGESGTREGLRDSEDR